MVRPHADGLVYSQSGAAIFGAGTQRVGLDEPIEKQRRKDSVQPRKRKREGNHYTCFFPRKWEIYGLSASFDHHNPMKQM